MRYIEFALADRFFYDRFRVDAQSTAGGRVTRYTPRCDFDESDWRIEESNGWRYIHPTGAPLPAQGWKIHCSATLDNAQDILTIVAAYCRSHRISFKYLPTSAEMMRSNMKYAHRGGSGKFITIYPASDSQCESILLDLDAELSGMAGPYILSDLRWNKGPLYVRYGGFVPKYVRNTFDELVAAIEDPSGTLVPDEREPAFRPPEWVALPPFIEQQRAALFDGDEPEFPYEVVDALHFSNGGGIYKAKDSAGAFVVLKEARPYAGISPDGCDAVARLANEYELTQQFQDNAAIVRCLGYFTHSEHHFLVEEFVEGITLNKELVSRHPLIRANQTREDRIAYRDWVLGITSQLTEVVQALHARGVVYADLHPNNIMITSDGAVKMIDFEMAYRVENEKTARPAGAPGFMPPDGRMGIAADLYSLACIKLSMFIPLTMVLDLDLSKAVQLVDEAQAAFDLPESYCSSIIEGIQPPVTTPNSSIHALRVSEVVDAWDITHPSNLVDLTAAITRGIVDSADFSRADRIFPGDIAQFSENAIGIAHGAAGNLLAVSDSLGHRADEVLDWIHNAVDTTPGFGPGFYDGLAGAAYTFRRFGRHDVADRWVNELCRLPFEKYTSDLYSGLSGIGCYLIDELARTPSNEVADAVDQIRAVLASRSGDTNGSIRREGDQVVAATGKGGLLRGHSGHALFWIRSYEAHGAPEDLARAHDALKVDLDVLVDCPDGSLQLNEGWRTLPYIGSGAAGVGLVLARLGQNMDISQHGDTLDRIAKSTTADFCVQSTFMNGRAGFVYFLSKMVESGRTQYREDLERQMERLRLHAVQRGVGIYFPGEQVLRCSTDWASGSAGVLDAIRSYRRARDGDAHREIPLIGIDRSLTLVGRTP
ncbi:class III lanthionine synthetase LanKC [Prescottella equi]